MAGVFSKQRFGNVNQNDIEQLRLQSKNKNTLKSTAHWFNVFKSWKETREIQGKIEEMKPEDLNKILEIFYAEVKNKDGEDYEPDSLRVMQTALDRHLKEKGYMFSIARDQEFTSSKEVREGKAKQLRLAGRGKRPNKARGLTTEEEEILWISRKFGTTDPESLISSVWWLLTQYFGLRGRQEHHDMKVQDFELLEDDNGVQFIQYTEGPTKTRQSGLKAKVRDFQPRMFAIGGERCPVGIFLEYMNRRPVSLRNTGPFYLAINHNRRKDDDVWFKAQPMDVNKINTMMKSIVAGTSLEESSKKFTNHSARKTLVKKLKKDKVERSSIAKVTGHRNIQSLDDYDECDEDEQKQLSLAISRRNNQPNRLSNSLAQVKNTETTSHTQSVQQFAALQSSQQLNRPCSSLQPSTSYSNQPQMSHTAQGFQFGLSFPTLLSNQSQKQMVVNHNTFHNCQVSFNIVPNSPAVHSSQDNELPSWNVDHELH
ncbi:hypothetical protein QZH41_006878 [Actinostola sp. cb2023]|nr:hypothetical protein QZH41_006878 [Actinostola sp. cb2023]